MKQLIIILLIWLLGCQSEPKDEIIWEQPQPEKVIIFDNDDIPSQTRNGEYWPLWYKESLTTDNYLLYPLPRKQEAYNKLKVDSIYMVRKNQNVLNIDGIAHGYYDVRVKFKGEPTGQPAVYISVLSGNNLAYIPYGANVLHSSNPYKIMTLVKTNDKIVYPEWVTGKPKTKYKYTIKGDTTSLGSEYLFGSTPTGTAFLLPHK